MGLPICRLVQGQGLPGQSARGQTWPQGAALLTYLADLPFFLTCRSPPLGAHITSGDLQTVLKQQHCVLAQVRNVRRNEDMARYYRLKDKVVRTDGRLHFLNTLNTLST